MSARAKSVDNTGMKPLGSRVDFDRMVDGYQDWYDQYPGRYYERYEKRALLQVLDRPHSGKLLEVGCGTGHFSRWFAGLGFDVTAVDVSAKMIAAAKKIAGPPVNYQLTDGHKLDFADGFFDVVAAVTVLEFAADAEQLLDEMARCVRVGDGRMLIGALNRDSTLTRKRLMKGRQSYRRARWFNLEELVILLGYHGEVEYKMVGHMPERERSPWMTNLYEQAGRLLRPRKGDFIAAAVRR